MTPPDPEALRVALIVIEALERLGIAYHLGGSYASAIHGIPRQTHDVDLIVALAPEQAGPLAELLLREFFIDVESVKRAATERSSCNLIHHATGVKIDLFVPGQAPFDESELSRRVAVRIGGGDSGGESGSRLIYVKSPEDILLRKLLWYRAGGEVSDRQWEDVRGIIRVQASRLDQGYLRMWAIRLGIEDLLDRVFASR